VKGLYHAHTYLASKRAGISWMVVALIGQFLGSSKVLQHCSRTHEHTGNRYFGAYSDIESIDCLIQIIYVEMRLLPVIPRESP
jgi:hypothetical protein